jgi:hypothetical protein
MTRMSDALRIHALVIIARALLRIDTTAEDINLVCRRRAGRILDKAAAWCDARARLIGGQALSGMQTLPGPA